MARVAERQDAELVLVVFPLFHRLDRYPFGDIHERLRALAERQGIAFVDLLPTFEGLDERALQTHPVTDFHPNHLAHRRAAEALLEALAW
jgi:lysophospholipase L1-like esterase